MLRKIFGILVFCTQAVIAADFLIQTRDAGLNWRELSSAQYREIVRARFDKTITVPQSDTATTARWVEASDAIAAGSTEEKPTSAICIRRNNTLHCN